MPEKTDVYCTIGFITFLLIISWAMLSSIEPTTYQPDGPMPDYRADYGIGEYAKQKYADDGQPGCQSVPQNQHMEVNMLAIIANTDASTNSNTIDGLGVALWVIGIVCILGLAYYIKVSFLD